MSRRSAVAAVVASLTSAGRAQAFGQDGAFQPRLLQTGNRAPDVERATGLSRWSWELIRRTSAPARLAVNTVPADANELLMEPFSVWMGSEAVSPLTDAEIRGLRQYFALGGMLFVDDSQPSSGAFGRSVRGELERVLPESPVVRLPAQHVLYNSYYILNRPVGRVEGPAYLEAVGSGKALRVLISAHDVVGALAQERGGSFTFPVEPGSYEQRELATRLAVNLAMFVLCLDYKDDQVHAEELMRRRGRQHR